MLFLEAKVCARRNLLARCGFSLWLAVVILAGGIWPAGQALGADTSDPVLALMVEKGMITETEAAKVQAQVDERRTNPVAIFPESKWKISSGIKDLEIFGDLRLRYEGREATDPVGGKIDLERLRYAVRLGLRGNLFDDFYYGLRLETAANSRSSFVTFGTSSSGTPYQGPFGKSTAGLNIGQVYLGWHPTKWLEVTAGKMPNPLYTSAMVWSPSINPEGLAERFKYSVGEVEFFATLGQFLYQDLNPVSAAKGLAINNLLGQTADNIFQIAWQGGLTYHITADTSVKIGATLYQYLGLATSTIDQGIAPYFGDPFVGEGAFTGYNTAHPVNGDSGYGTSSTLPGYESLGYPNNQVGLDHLEVLEVPFEINFKINKLDCRIFGDVAYNLAGSQRAEAASAGYAAYFLSLPTSSTISAFAPQKQECKAYQFGVAVGSENSLGLVNGTTAKRHSWEVRSYWQHIEQYALDPNLLDQDLFEGRGNLEGIFAAAAYGFTDNFIGTVRYGYATRINNKLGTGGSGQDIPQINPINDFDLLQVDLTFKF